MAQVSRTSAALFEQIGQLIETRGADDRRRDAGASDEPGQRHLAGVAP